MCSSEIVAPALSARNPGRVSSNQPLCTSILASSLGILPPTVNLPRVSKVPSQLSGRPSKLSKACNVAGSLPAPIRRAMKLALAPLAQIQRLDVGQHRVQAGKQGEQHAPPSLAIAAALPVRLQEAREETPDRAMHIKALTGLDDALGRGIRIAVETPDHASDI